MTIIKKSDPLERYMQFAIIQTFMPKHMVNDAYRRK